MASTDAAHTLADIESDYGSDLDTDGEQAIAELLSELEAGAPKPFVLESIEEDALTELVPAVHLPKADAASVISDEELSARLERKAFREPSVEVEYDESSRKAWKIADLVALGSTREASIELEATPDVPDTRSPLERFRTPPKKPLSVTDLVSPAWCELQYWYTLTKHGRKKRTPAMKQGSAVHKELEEQVHTIVEVKVKTREDAWGLKIWNVIQGLRTLRLTGMTRELEVWGLLDGQVVNGIIDELSYSCPDPELEESTEMKKRNRSEAEVKLPSDQTSITDFWKSKRTAGLEASPWIGDPVPQRKVYLTDVKTRGSKTLPQGPSLRPTIMQLSLYRKLLADLATNAINAETVFSRYNLQARENFSDAFIAEIGSLDYNFRYDSSSDDESPFGNTQDSVVELLAHSNLLTLWALMIHEFSKTIDGVAGIGDVLKAEFRNSKDGSIIGGKTFAYDEPALLEYVKDEMSWWKGEREARGVDIEEAFKCRICEFAEECTWRKAKIDEATEKHRLRTRARTRSAV